MTQPLLQVRALKMFFPVYGGALSRPIAHVQAVNDVSFDISRGETLGMVGESGCGKTTVGRITIRLLDPTSGSVLFDGVDIATRKEKAMRTLRPRMQIVFQDPYGSLNPRFTVEQIVGEAMLAHGLATRRDVKDKIGVILDKVGLSPGYMKRYPHEFSGGQRQRIGIARALALNPEYIVCDEPVSALDVSIQAQIINLLQKLQEDFRLSLLFISHDLNVVKHLSHRIAVMYLGKLVEVAPAAELMREPAHPYTQALLASNPTPEPGKRRERIILSGDVPSPMNPPSGCHFHPRCPKVMEQCRSIQPKSVKLNADHQVECHLYG